MLHVLILWVAIAVGFGAAKLHRKVVDEPRSGAFGSSLGFIAAMFGILVVTASGHYSDARSAGQTDATTIVSLSNDVSALQPAVALPVQRPGVVGGEQDG